MRKIKRTLASLLAALLLVTSLPVTALAAANDAAGEEAAEQTVQTVDSSEQPAEEDPAEVNSVEEAPTEVNPAEEDPAVVNPVEEPAAVDVDPEDVELVGLVANVNGVEIYAMPSVATMSLLPLETRTDFTLDLTGFFPEELKSVGVSTLLASIKDGSQVTLPAGSNIAVYARWYYYDPETDKYVSENDNYTPVVDGTMDLSFVAHNSVTTSTFTLELIVGTANQLDASNKRYRVRVTTSQNPFQFETAGDKNYIVSQYPYINSRWSDETQDPNPLFYQLTISSESTWELGNTLPLLLGLNSALVSSGTGVKVEYQAPETSSSTDITGTIYKSGSNTPSGYAIPLANNSDPSTMPKLSVTMTRADGTTITRTLYLRASKSTDSISTGLYDPSSGIGVTRSVTRGEADSHGIQPWIYEMSSGRDANGTWAARATYSHDSHAVSVGDLGSYITRTVVGYYATAAETEASGLTDITSQLFAATGKDGYQANYSNGVYFTIVKADNTLQHLCIKTIPYEVQEYTPTPSDQTYLNVTGAYDAASGISRSLYSAYRISSEHDGYGNTYQTIFLMDTSSTYTYSPIDETTIYPVFSTRVKESRVYAGNSVPGAGGTEQSGGVIQTSEVSAQPFAAANPSPIQYTVYSEDWTHYQNYWVTFITQQTGAKLFVNGVTNAAESHKIEQEDGTKIATREVHLDSADSYHDIFFANIGDTDMTGLTLTAIDLVNVEIDPYWTIRDNSTLAGLTTTDTASYSELPNVGKVRLRPIIDPETGLPMPGPISGTLTFTHSGGETVKVQLIGTSGQLEITTDSLNEGVKYVPYISAIQTNYIGSGADTSMFTFSITSGVSNTDIALYKTGELYGMPMNPGTWTFTVSVRYDCEQAVWNALSEESKARLSAEKEFTLVINDNLDDPVVDVPGEFSYGYEVLNFIGNHQPQNDQNYHYVLDQYEDWDFRSAGDFSKFVNFYIDGILVAQTKYSVRDGSTVITIFGDTFEETGDGKHTIAAEFFDDANPANLSTMKTSAQNYYMEAPLQIDPQPPAPQPPAPQPPAPQPTPTPDSEPSEQPEIPEQPVTSELPFADVNPGNWFYEDVKWVYDHGYMLGETGNRFDPDGLISQATIVVVLARLANIDLTRFVGITMEDVPAGTWYTEAAIWAKQIGLLPDNTLFTGEDPLERESMAIMLVKYLRSLGMDTTLEGQSVVFTDADRMTPDGNAAFQVLYHYSVFRGYGNNVMGPTNYTTRAEFSALVRRISGLMDAEG